MDEGYIKFKCEWTQSEAFSSQALAQLCFARQQMYRLGVIGAYPDGIGFGNISQRHQDQQFFISGSATGNFAELNNSHFSLVTHFNIDRNEVQCQGPIIASSESMSHAVIYQTCPEVNAVIHIHHLALWKKVLHHIPTTAANIAYGTPEMAKAIIALLQEKELRWEKRFLAMAGHQEGLIAFGTNLTEAGQIIEQYLPQLH